MRSTVLAVGLLCVVASPAAAQITKKPTAPVTPPKASSKIAIVVPSVSGMSPTSGIWNTKVTLTGTNLDKFTGAKVIWYPSDIENGEPQGPVPSMYTVKSSSSAEAYIPVSSGGGANGPVVRLVLTGPFGDVLAGKFTVDRTTRVDQFAVKHQNLYQIKDWGEPGDRLDISGVNLDRTMHVDFMGGPQGTVVGASFSQLQFTIPLGCNGVAKWILRGPNQSDYVTPKTFTCWARPKVDRIVPSSLAWGGTFTIEGANLAQVTRVSGNGGFNVNVTCSASACNVTLPKIAWTTPVSGALSLEGGKEVVMTAQSITITPSP